MVEPIGVQLPSSVRRCCPPTGPARSDGHRRKEKVADRLVLGGAGSLLPVVPSGASARVTVVQLAAAGMLVASPGGVPPVTPVAVTGAVPSSAFVAPLFVALPPVRNDRGARHSERARRSSRKGSRPRPRLFCRHPTRCEEGRQAGVGRRSDVKRCRRIHAGVVDRDRARLKIDRRAGAGGVRIERERVGRRARDGTARRPERLVRRIPGGYRRCRNRVPRRVGRADRGGPEVLHRDRHEQEVAQRIPRGEA